MPGPTIASVQGAQSPSLFSIGVILVLVAAVLLVLTPIVFARVLPTLVMPVLIATWTLGTVGFLIVCIEEPSAFNIVIGVLFILSSVYHGRRIAGRIREAASKTNNENP